MKRFDKIKAIGAGILFSLTLMLIPLAIFIMFTKGCAEPPVSEPEPVAIDTELKWHLADTDFSKVKQRYAANVAGLHELDLLHSAFKNMRPAVSRSGTLEYFRIQCLFHQARAKYLENISIAAYALDWGDAP